MSYEFRTKRMNKVLTSWGLNKVHDLMVEYSIPSFLKEELLTSIKLYVSKALAFDFVHDEKKFMEKVEFSRVIEKMSLLMELLYQKENFT